jgi:hypothetical protein
MSRDGLKCCRFDLNDVGTEEFRDKALEHITACLLNRCNMQSVFCSSIRRLQTFFLDQMWHSLLLHGLSPSECSPVQFTRFQNSFESSLVPWYLCSHVCCMSRGTCVPTCAACPLVLVFPRVLRVPSKCYLLNHTNSTSWRLQVVKFSFLFSELQ